MKNGTYLGVELRIPTISGSVKSYLQQTQVQTVISLLRALLDWFPTVKDLAEAPEEKLLKAWEGLGYYSRVRNMQRPHNKS